MKLMSKAHLSFQHICTYICIDLFPLYRQVYTCPCGSYQMFNGLCFLRMSGLGPWRESGWICPWGESRETSTASTCSSTETKSCLGRTGEPEFTVWSSWRRRNTLLMCVCKPILTESHQSWPLNTCFFNYIWATGSLGSLLQLYFIIKYTFM